MKRNLSTLEDAMRVTLQAAGWKRTSCWVDEASGTVVYQMSLDMERFLEATESPRLPTPETAFLRRPKLRGGTGFPYRRSG
jgi:hypothetical protein